MDLFWVVFVENGLLVSYVNEDLFFVSMKVEDHLVKLSNGDKERERLWALFSVSSSMVDNKLFAKMLECTPQRWRNWLSNPYNVHTKKGKNGPKKTLLMWFVRHKSNSVSLVKTYYLTDMCLQMLKSCCMGKSAWILLFCHTNQLQFKHVHNCKSSMPH
jgi:hypothetical protein